MASGRTIGVTLCFRPEHLDVTVEDVADIPAGGASEGAAAQAAQGAAEVPAADAKQTAARDPASEAAADATKVSAQDATEAVTAQAAAIDLGTAVVEDVAFFGTHHRAHLAPEEPDAASSLQGSAATGIVAHLPQVRAISPGDRLRVRLNAAMAVVLATDED